MTRPRSPINLFFEEPLADRFFWLDRYPRRLLWRLRSRHTISGHRRVFLNLCAGLDRLGIAYRVNDYRHALRHDGEVACIVGKASVLDRVAWRNPILFGPAVFSHPTDDPHLFERLPVARVLVAGEWMRRMFEPYFGSRVAAWPVGIDTEGWSPRPETAKDIDVLVYEKILWKGRGTEDRVLAPVHDHLRARGLVTATLRYGSYREGDYRSLLLRSRCMIFVCEHETQGIACQQALSCDVPVLAWDQGGMWLDPKYYPHRVRFSPVTSVPYWSEACGAKFADGEELPARFDAFFDAVRSGAFAPRRFVTENLSLEKQAREYAAMVADVERAVGLGGPPAR